MEDRHFRVERQKASKDRKYFKSSIPQGTGYESKMMWYLLPYACLSELQPVSVGYPD